MGNYELELGYNNEQEDNVDERTQLLEFAFKRGLTDWLDIGICFPYQISPNTEKLIGEINLGLKFALIKDMLSFSIDNDLGTKVFS